MQTWGILPLFRQSKSRGALPPSAWIVMCFLYAAASSAAAVSPLSAAAPASGSGSFEVKKMLTVANIKKMLLSGRQQLVLGARGYLVATAIADDRVEQELRMLSALHGIGVILLDPENPSESEILLPAQKKPDADWQSIDRLAKENGDFHEFIELVSVYFQTGTLREKDWDNKTA
mgnify:CR=1 FL=1